MALQRIFEKHPHWQEIVGTLKVLHAAGHEALLAGGCVRDALLNQVAQDFDIATSATPDQVAQLFPKAIDVGRQFGVMIVPFTVQSEHGPSVNFQIEIATFRADGLYVDGRHPETVTFSSPAEDAERRDFTVNALFYDLRKSKVIDFVGGEKDLALHVLRAVGDASARFTEDKLRMLRAARFVAQLNFAIEEKTLSAIQGLAADIKVVSRERITDEFKKLSRASHLRSGFQILFDTGLLKAIWPNLKSDTMKDSFLHSVDLLNGVGSFELLVANLLLLDYMAGAKNNTVPMLNWNEMPFVLSREMKRDIEFLLHGFFVLRENTDEALLLLNEDLGPLLTELGFIMASLGHLSEAMLGELLDRFLQVSDDTGRLPPPFLTGDDMIRLGVKPSAHMGEMLHNVYLLQIRGELKSKLAAETWTKNQLKNQSARS